MFTIKSIDNVHTTEDCVLFGQYVLSLAQNVKTREQHATCWDLSIDLLHKVNNALQTGYFIDEDYDNLHHAKSLVNKAQRVAGEQAVKTYASNANRLGDL